MTDKSWVAATDLEREGKYEEAAAMLVVVGVEDITESNFEVSTKYIIGLGKLLEAVSCDVLADNTHRARHVQELYEHLALAIVDGVSHDAMRGMLREWVGDSHLLIESDAVFEWYDRAEAYYGDLDQSTQLQWGASQEYDYADHGYELFIESRGEDALDYNKAPINFHWRIDQKRAIAQRILADESDSA